MYYKREIPLNTLPKKKKVKYNIDRQKEIGMERKQWYLRVGSQANAQIRKQINDSGVTIPKGSEMVLGFDNKLHFGDWTIELQKNMNLIDGVSAT